MRPTTPHGSGNPDRQSLSGCSPAILGAPPEREPSRLNFLLSNCTWQQGTQAVEYKEPSDMLAETVAAAARVEATCGSEIAQKEIWLAFVDDYRTKCIVPQPRFRLIMESLARLGRAA